MKFKKFSLFSLKALALLLFLLSCEEPTQTEPVNHQLSQSSSGLTPALDITIEGTGSNRLLVIEGQHSLKRFTGSTEDYNTLRLYYDSEQVPAPNTGENKSDYFAHFDLNKRGHVSNYENVGGIGYQYQDQRYYSSNTFMGGKTVHYSMVDQEMLYKYEYKIPMRDNTKNVEGAINNELVGYPDLEIYGYLSGNDEIYHNFENDVYEFIFFRWNTIGSGDKQVPYNFEPPISYIKFAVFDNDLVDAIELDPVSLISELTHNFTWTESKYAESYELEWSTNSSFSSSTTETINNRTTTSETISFPNDGTYFVRVKSIKGAAIYTSDTKTVTVQTIAPLTISPDLWPTNVALASDSNPQPTVTWSVSSTGGTNPKTYQWYENGILINHNNTVEENYTKTFTSASSSYSYTLEAKVTDANGLSNSYSTTINVTAPPPPFVAPSISLTNDGGNPKASWASVSGAVQYQIERSFNGFSHNYYTTNLNHTDTDRIISSGGITTYYRVRAKNSAGEWSDWSNTENFKTIFGAE